MSAPTFPVQLKVTNYRCFGDRNPLVIKLDKGFTAFTGPNDAGKSAVLKFFIELRHLWQVLGANPQDYRTFLQVRAGNVGPQHVVESNDIFSDFTDGPLEIEFDFEENTKGSVEVAWLKLSIERNSFVTTLAIRSGRHEAIARTGANEVRVITQTTLEAGSIQVDVARAIELFKVLGGGLYIPAYRNCINAGGANHYGLAIGTSFIEVWDEWKNGTSKASSTAIVKTTDDIRQVLGYDSLEINASKAKDTLRLVVDGRIRSLNELGSGVAQFILILGNVLITKPTMILIDEPELNLHPAKQVELLRSLAANVTSGIVLFATHSMGLARTIATDVYSVQKPPTKRVTVQPMPSKAGLLELLGEMNYAAHREVGVEALLFVEGVTDVLPLRRFLRLYEKDAKVMILPLLGDCFINGKRLLELSELQRLGVPCHAIIDSERTNAGAALAKNRQDFVDTWQSLRFAVHVLERRALENYLSDHAIKKVSSEHTAVGPFELLTWSKTENGKIAEHMVRADLEDTDLGKFLSLL